jgi:hypothetical protein
MRQVAPFSLAQIQSHCTGASPQLIKKVLAQMKAAGTVELSGRGRSAKWKLKN